LKADLDRALQGCGAFTWGLGTTLVNDTAQRPIGSTPSTQTGTPPPAPKPPSGDFLAQLAAQMGVPKDTLIWGLAGLGLLLFLKK